jgi:hypothetical protein
MNGFLLNLVCRGAGLPLQASPQPTTTPQFLPATGVSDDARLDAPALLEQPAYPSTVSERPRAPLAEAPSTHASRDDALPATAASPLVWTAPVLDASPDLVEQPSARLFGSHRPLEIESRVEPTVESSQPASSVESPPEAPAAQGRRQRETVVPRPSGPSPFGETSPVAAALPSFSGSAPTPASRGERTSRPSALEPKVNSLPEGAEGGGRAVETPQPAVVLRDEAGQAFLQPRESVEADLRPSAELSMAPWFERERLLEERRVEVRIGRVEVRAVRPEGRPAAPQPRGPSGFDDYLLARCYVDQSWP